MKKNINEIFIDELPCDLSETPRYLKSMLASDRYSEAEKYAAIERFTLVYEGSPLDQIEWPEEGLDDLDEFRGEKKWIYSQRRQFIK